jgi:hypothetical protein
LAASLLAPRNCALRAPRSRKARSAPENCAAKKLMLDQSCGVHSCSDPPPVKRRGCRHPSQAGASAAQ